MGDILRENYEKLIEEKIAFFKQKGAKAYIEKYGHYLPGGQEVCDPTPMSIPVGCKKPLTLQEQLARLTPMAAYGMSRQWSDGDENEDDLLDPEDPEDVALLEEIASRNAVKAPRTRSKGVPATPVADTNQSAAQESENDEEPDSE